jgi:hypothetical protein
MDEKQKEQFQKLARMVAGLIRTRSPTLSKNALKAEALVLSRVAVIAFPRFRAGKNHAERTGKQSREELKQIVGLAGKLSKVLSGLSLSSEIDLTIYSPDLKTENVIYSLNDLKTGAAEALKKGHRQKGNKRDFSKEWFCETVLQIYERARDISLEAIPAKKGSNYRQHMADVFRLMEVCISASGHRQYLPSLKKFTQRYIADGRPEKAEVAVSLQEELATLQERTV